MRKTQQERNAAYRAKRRTVKAIGGAGPGRFSDDPERWLVHYMPRSYPLPFGRVHRDIIAEFCYALTHGGRTSIAAPRGTGKSTLVYGLTLWALLTRRTEFPVVLPWADKARKQAIRFWVNELCFNERLAQDYGEACAPFVQCGGVAQKLANLTDPATGKTTGAQLQVTDGMIVLPADLGAIGSATINGNPRGLNYKTRGGDVKRPTLAVIDDPQDRKTARSPARVQEAIEKIDGDVAGMAGPDSAMAIVMTCTVIQSGDVADHYLTAPDWRAVRVEQIEAWPRDWSRPESEARRLWEAWNDERLSGTGEKDGGARALAFYTANRAAMVDGMAVSWPERFDRARGQPDALYAAMMDYYVMGHAAFMAERQNQPVTMTSAQYELTREIVLTHVGDLPRLHLPSGFNVFNGFIDINRHALSFVLAGFDQSMSCHVPAWGMWKPPGAHEVWSKNAPELERKQAIFRGLKAVCDGIAATQFVRAGQPCRPSTILIDRGYEPDVVHKFCASAAYPFRLMASRGYAAHKYWPRKASLIGKPMEGCHFTTGEAGPFLAFNADLWRETYQRAFLAMPGAPGGIMLHAVASPGQHNAFADQAVAEKLANKYETDAGPRWEWTHKPGSVWDLGDALEGCYVAAAAMGLSPSGQPTIARKPQGRVRARGVSVVAL